MIKMVTQLTFDHMETFFLKSKELYLKQELLYDKLEDFNISESEIESINNEIDGIDDDIIDIDYHNLFLIEDENMFSSKQECLQWVNNPKNTVVFKSYFYQGKDLTEEQCKQICLDKLDNFWESYPSGLIITCSDTID